MSTLVLSKVGSVVGGALLGPLGTMIGGTLGALGGAVIDNMLLAGGRDTHTTGPRLDSLQVTSSTEGSPINRAYGRVRIGGQVIWATTLEEVASTTKQGGKRWKPMRLISSAAAQFCAPSRPAHHKPATAQRNASPI